MRTSDTVGALAKALSEAQGELQNAEKSKEGYGYKYADLAQILDIARPVLSQHGLAVIQLPHNADGGIAVTTRLMHESGEWIEDTIVMEVEVGKLSRAQAAGTVITYERRYALSAVLGIAQEDPDASEKGERVAMPRETINREQATALIDALKASHRDPDLFLRERGINRYSEVTVAQYKKEMAELMRGGSDESE